MLSISTTICRIWQVVFKERWFFEIATCTGGEVSSIVGRHQCHNQTHVHVIYIPIATLYVAEVNITLGGVVSRCRVKSSLPSKKRSSISSTSRESRGGSPGWKVRLLVGRR